MRVHVTGAFVLAAHLGLVACGLDPVNEPTAFECSSDDSCPSDSHCVAGTKKSSCVLGCGSDADCTDRFSKCSGIHGSCVCRNDDECDTGFRCQERTCSDKTGEFVCHETNCVTELGDAVVDDQNVYFTLSTAIMKVPVDGGAPTVIATVQVAPWGIAKDATSLYWVSGSEGSLTKVSLDGGNPSGIATGISIGGAWPWKPKPTLVVDDKNAYWIPVGLNQDPTGSVMKVSLQGGDPVELATGQIGPSGLAVEGTSVYWTTKDAVMNGLA